MAIIKYPGIRGQLRVKMSEAPDEGDRIYLEGDPEGLRSLAALLLRLAEIDQRSLESLPERGASEHLHLNRGEWLTPQSTSEFVVGRLDDKRGHFDETFRPRPVSPQGDIVHRW